jgi:hypothetical protein
MPFTLASGAITRAKDFVTLIPAALDAASCAGD